MPGCDMISELPDSLLTQILSYLPTGDSVQTGILSKRWKNLWLSVPALDLNCFLIAYEDDEEVLFTFVERFLEFSPESSLLKVKVRCRPLMIDGFMDRVGTMISRGTQHLDVVSRNCYFEERGMYYACVEFMPMNLYTSKTLVYLKLSSSGLMDPGCPVLEELTLARDPDDDYALRNDEFGVMRVRSQSLKRFSVLPLREVRDYHSIVKCTLEIDAPGLEYMSLGEDQFDSIVVKNLTSLIMVNLDIKFVINLNGFFDPWDASKRNEIRGFLNGISSVRHIIISEKTVKALDLYSKGGMIPKFNNLSRLEAVFPSALLQFLPAFLECCPNLKHLVLKVVHSEEMNEGLELTDVPRCVSTTLECVEIKDKFEWEEEKMKVASYFLENSAVLKKFILSPTAYNQNIYEKVNKLAKRSTVCQIIHE
uniref:F-box domain-containing protein n=1 Tax=Brassica campestris TaxID=3711 RepID=M4EDM5_BRACM